MKVKSAVVILFYLAVIKCSHYGSNSYSNDLSLIRDECFLDCDPYEVFRRTDGSCNNLNITWWGKSMTKYVRLIPSEYDDGVGKPRSRSINGSPLPSPRDIANMIHYPRDRLIDLTHLSVVFGQWVFHDVSSLYMSKDHNGDLIKCSCNSKHRDCLKIPICKDDYYFGKQECMIQIRSADVQNECDGSKYAKVRTQLNEVNSFIDLSTLYGNTQKTEDSLRAHVGGRLSIVYFKGTRGAIMPTSCPVHASKLIKDDEICFHAGDDRVNQYATLSALHNIWVREHNRVADELAQINPHWDDERLFQETKRILIAVYQNIVYWEWLPYFIGKETHMRFGLDHMKTGYWDRYDPNLNPNVKIEFSVAAGRVGHSLVRNFVTRANNKFVTTYNYTLEDLMFSPKLLIPGDNFEQFFTGMIKDLAYELVPHVNNQLNNWLVVDHGKYNPTKYYSLPALNINRGREVGLPSYVEYLKFLKLKVPKSFDDLENIPGYLKDRFSKIYSHVEDIDLYSGALAEIPYPDAVVGPTFAYILADGFSDWKYGDRFWFENSGRINPYPFTLEQLDMIRGIRYNSIVCNNLNLDKVPFDVFVKADRKYNPLVSCDKIHQLDLSLFREKPSSY